jgi:hypothetical protein
MLSFDRKSGDSGMRSTDPRIDAHIRKSEPFARPILAHLRRSFTTRVRMSARP